MSDEQEAREWLWKHCDECAQDVSKYSFVEQALAAYGRLRKRKALEAARLAQCSCCRSGVPFGTGNRAGMHALNDYVRDCHASQIRALLAQLDREEAKNV